MSKFIELTAKDGSKVLLNTDVIFEISGEKHCHIVYKRPLEVDGERYEYERFRESYETVKSLLAGEQKPPKVTAEMINDAGHICNRRDCTKCEYREGIAGGLCKCRLIADYINERRGK